MKVIVGDLPYNATEEEIRELFATQGEVVAVTLPVDHVTGQIKGTAIVEMATRAGAEDAVHHLRQRRFHGRRLRVRLAMGRELADAAEELMVEEQHPPKPHTRTLPHRPERSPGR
jgi:RNA recognition motif-containing protein